MKVILLIDDKKLGKKYDVKEVADGYARNVLIPKGIVMQATKENLRKLNALVEKEQKEYAENIAQATLDAEKIRELEYIILRATCSNDGKMFGAITAKDIAQELSRCGVIVKKQDVVLPEVIKEIGTTTVTIKLFNGISEKIKVIIEE